jgi:thiamine transport system ATP-binding protein
VTLRLEHVGVTYGDRAALIGVDLTVGTGRTLTVLGESGSGKSTLLRAIAGLEPATGRVHWEDTDLTEVPTHRRGIGMVFQDHALLPHRDVLGNVRFGLEGRGSERATATDRAAALIARVGLEGYEHRSVTSLSGGEAQRVALARALAPEPRVLLLDEPYGALDRERRDRLMVEVRSILRTSGVTVVHVTHDHDEAFALGDAVAILHHGRLEQVGDPDDVWHHPATARVARFLGATNEVDGEATTDGVVTTALGQIGVPGVAAGPVRLLWRPEALRVEPGGPIRGRVIDTTFRRAHHLVTVETAAGRFEAISGAVGRPGESLDLRLDGSAVHVFGR